MADVARFTKAGGTEGTSTLAWLRWLALVPIVVAVPILFFGMIWSELPMIAIGIVLLAAAAGIWIVFAADD